MRIIATITKRPGTFVRHCYTVTLKHEDGSVYYRPMRYRRSDGSLDPTTHYIPDPCNFAGNDGRKVRAEAIAWAKLFTHEVITTATPAKGNNK